MKISPIFRLALLYGAALIALPLLVGAGGVALKLVNRPEPGVPEGFTAAPPVHRYHPDKLTAVFMAGAHGTEISDLLPPFQIIGETGAFNLYVVGPTRDPLPLNCGLMIYTGLNVVPHFSFDEYDRRFPDPPDLLVVPYMPKPTSDGNRAMADWMRDHVGPDTHVLTVCAGAEAFAATGLFDGRRATTHESWIPKLRESHPGTEWITDARYVQDGAVISSAAVASGMDATFATIEAMLGRETAERTAAALHYPHMRYLDETAFTPPPTDLSGLWRAAYQWRTDRVGLFLDHGADELTIGAVLDLFPLTLATHTTALTQAPTTIVSRHGMHLAPRHTLESAPPLERLFAVTGGEAPSTELAAWASTRNLKVEWLDSPDRPPAFPYATVLSAMSKSESQRTAVSAARNLKYPEEGLNIEGPPVAARWMIRPALIALLGVAVVYGYRWRRTHRNGAKVTSAPLS